ncbi:N-acetylmuramoyl-L-alanine amidase [Shimia thalassica]|uniref:N-acetylmuramoyl-L-alanine amidase n=1 Tax=Shimia thalassica TaxID=1715693 RepID=UPI0026E1B755|nr:N-acetylmuramoyl-L-alanine amidase [Shimia thalassica]MDO6520526.1 N-acetylmuramoyl-L-alanine amidase [Shimia thalassica]
MPDLSAPVIQAPCESFGPRRDNARPDLVVVHYTAMDTAEAALERLCDPAVEVSAHYLIAENGRLWQMVPEEMRAWHAGAGAWGDVTDVNSRSIGIELANTGQHPFPEPQMRVLESLLRDISVRWGILPEGVIGHSDMAPGRKCDPGPRFDWTRLALQGLALRLPKGAAKAPNWDVFRNTVKAFGFPDVPDDTLLEAVRLRFRPWGQGALDAEDMRVCDGLARLLS